MSHDDADEENVDPSGTDESSDPDDAGTQNDAVAEMYGKPGESPIDPSSESDSEDSADGPDDSGEFDAPLLGGGDDEEPEETTGKFYVKYAQDSAVTLHDVSTSQICTLIENPGFETHEIIEATLIAQPPMEVSYLVKDLESHWKIPVETSPEPPTTNVMKISREMDEGEAIAIEREGEGEIHILAVDPAATARTADELYEDETIYKNAARYEVERVEIRTDEEKGIVSIRYLP